MNDKLTASGFAGDNRRVITGFRGLVRRWRAFVAVVVVVLLVVGVFSVAEGSGLPDLPDDIAGLVVEAVEICDVSADAEPACAEAAWVACEALREYWDREGHWFGFSRDLPDFDRHKYLPREFVCYGAHMAELGELAAVLAERNGDVFYEEKTGATENEAPVSVDFWQFREHITYTPWFPYEIYTFNDGDGPGLRQHASNSLYQVGRWLDRVQDWGDRDKPSPREIRLSAEIVYDPFDPRIEEMSESTVALLDLFLGSISDRTKLYDSWPLEVNLDPQTGGSIRGVSAANANTRYNYPYFYIGGDFAVSEVGREVIAICSKAVFSARKGLSGWEEEISDCSEAAIPCIESSYGGDLRCVAVTRLADLEGKWQRLPHLCASSGESKSDENICHSYLSDICRDQEEFSGHLWPYELFRRRFEIKGAACALAGEITYGSISPVAGGV